VLAVGSVFNAIPSLRELERAFARVNAVLEPGRLFMFDLYTIRGLATARGTCDQVYYDNGDDLAVTLRNRFSYETLSNSRSYTIWQRQGELWQRRDEIHVERGYPAQGVSVMLERTGFRVAAVLSPALEPFDPGDDLYEQVIFVAEKQPG
jgi:hypothetical protein